LNAGSRFEAAAVDAAQIRVLGTDKPDKPRDDQHSPRRARPVVRAPGILVVRLLGLAHGVEEPIAKLLLELGIKPRVRDLQDVLVEHIHIFSIQRVVCFPFLGINNSCSLWPSQAHAKMPQTGVHVPVAMCSNVQLPLKLEFSE